MLLTRVIKQKSRNECLDAMLYESGRKSSDAMPFVQLSSSDTLTLRGTIWNEAGKLIGAFVAAAGTKILLLTGRNDRKLLSSSSESTKLTIQTRFKTRHLFPHDPGCTSTQEGTACRSRRAVRARALSGAAKPGIRGNLRYRRVHSIELVDFEDI
jgi:hypothetical protein